MKAIQYKKLTGIFLIMVPIVLAVPWTGLMITFDYPDILRLPAGQILEQFDAGGSWLIALWYGMVLASILFIPLVLLLHNLLAHEDTPYMPVASTFGGLAALFNVLGFIRWPFLVTMLAKQYVDPLTTQASRESLETIFEAFHLYAGVAVGEHLGFFFTSVWTVLAGLAIIKARPIAPWLGLVWIISGLGVFLGVFEWVGFKAAAEINAYAFVVLELGTILTGTFVLLDKSYNRKVN